MPATVTPYGDLRCYWGGLCGVAMIFATVVDHPAELARCQMCPADVRLHLCDAVPNSVPLAAGQPSSIEMRYRSPQHSHRIEWDTSFQRPAPDSRRDYANVVPLLRDVGPQGVAPGERHANLANRARSEARRRMARTEQSPAGDVAACVHHGATLGANS
jgi:hypothetical protein